MHLPLSLALFCKVIDNFGDIGICWRLARQLQQEHEIAVTLWVDDLASFQRICPEVRIDLNIQEVGGVTVQHWRDQTAEFSAADIADIVIEFFGCELPPAYVDAMAQCQPRPVWLNLEGLSAEAWVEGCHTLPSMHSRLPLTKHFFYPGFTDKTGGLLHESTLAAQRQEFQADPTAIAAFLVQLGVTPAEMTGLKVSLFCYPHALLSALLQVWQTADAAITCLVPEGVAADAMEEFLGVPPKSGVVRTSGALTVRIVPFMTQPDYDRLLWACDVNFVRGEDSFVRAQWAGKPFIWHIYPQENNLHHVKLRAFLQRYAKDITSLSALALEWNGAGLGGVCDALSWQKLWGTFHQDIPQMTHNATVWRQKILANGDLASNLLQFVDVLRLVAAENHV